MKVENELDFETEVMPRGFEIFIGWRGYIKGATILLNKEECKLLVKELEEFIKVGE